MGSLLLALAVAVSPSAPGTERPAFIENDYPRAIREARERKLPLFVEASAPWCHSCRSLKAFVLNDPSLGRQAPRFVWLEINTDDERNATLQDKLQIDGVPTLFVVDPADEHVALRHLGAPTLDGLHRLLDDGAAAIAGASTGIGQGLARADALYGAGKHAEAAAAYAELLSSAPEEWPARNRISLARLDSLSLARDHEPCARWAQQILPVFRATYAAAAVATSGLDCATSLPETSTARAALVAELESAGREIAADRKLPVPADDRSSLYLALVDVRKEKGDAEGARALAAECSAFLESEAVAAATPEQRAVFDAHRTYALIAAGRPQDAIPFLQQAEKDRPSDPDPPSRLARVYGQLKRWDEALAASDRSLARASGFTRVTQLRIRSDLELARGDKAAGRRFLDEALATAQALPSGKKADGVVAGIRKQIASLEAPAKS
jgi:tetratricopeptide (TPR) repeat protein